MSRRAVLTAGAGAVVLAACGSNKGGGGGGKAKSGSTKGTNAAKPDDLEVVIASSQLVAGSEQRVTVGVFRDAEPLATSAPLQLAFGPAKGTLGPPQPAVLHTAGIEERPYYLTSYRFDRPGVWDIAATTSGKVGGAQVQVIDPGEARGPVTGQPMVALPTPTKADHHGVNPICTRSPVCSFHDVSLDQALGEHRPVAALFATPALCQSKVCGPVLEVLLEESAPFADRVRFVHVEVYKSLQTNFTEDDLSPGMKAYHLNFEPVLFLAGADGVVRERLDGPYDRLECRGALTRLIS